MAAAATASGTAFVRVLVEILPREFVAALAVSLL
jgi:hypothetical protein